MEMNKLFITALSHHFIWDAWRVVRNPAERALERFTETVPAELGLSRVRVEVHIDDLTFAAPPNYAAIGPTPSTELATCTKITCTDLPPTQRYAQLLRARNPAPVVPMCGWFVSLSEQATPIER
jgi:hypothetical protein